MLYLTSVCHVGNGLNLWTLIQALKELVAVYGSFRFLNGHLKIKLSGPQSFRYHTKSTHLEFQSLFTDTYKYIHIYIMCVCVVCVCVYVSVLCVSTIHIHFLLSPSCAPLALRAHM